MKDTILAQIMGLKGLSTEELLKKYEELFGTSTGLSTNPEQSRRVGGKKAPSPGYIVGN